MIAWSHFGGYPAWKRGGGVPQVAIKGAPAARPRFAALTLIFPGKTSAPIRRTGRI
jgi:hypothetical protein